VDQHHSSTKIINMFFLFVALKVLLGDNRKIFYYKGVAFD
jgi:hypothetical protein